MVNKIFHGIVLFAGCFLSSLSFAIEAPSFMQRLMEPEKVTISAFASMVVDPMCELPVEPFDIPNQLITISKIMSSIAFAGGDYRVGLEAAKTMNWLTVDAEVMLGEQLHELNKKTVIRRGTKNKRYMRLYAKVDKVLGDITSALPKELPFDLKLFITTNQGINASAYAGGFIYLTKEAAEKDNDFLAVLLAHEVFHVAQRHTTRQYQSTLIDVIDSVDRFKSLLGSGASIKELGSLGLLTATVLTSYGVKQEEQADICAGRLVSRLPGYNSSRGVDGFLAISAKREKSTIPMFASHPSSEKRRDIFNLALSKPMKGKSALHRKDHVNQKTKSARKSRQSLASTGVGISALLKIATSQVSANKLTSPKGDCAYETYRFVLDKKPNNVRALKGISDIAGRYVAWGNGSLAKGNTDKANTYLAKAKYVDDSHPGVKKLNEKLGGGTNGEFKAAAKKLGAGLNLLGNSIGSTLGLMFN